MLLNIRENMQSWVAWLIVILISIPFALWGINSYFSGASEVVVAKVNGNEILLQEYQQAMTQHKRRLRSILGKNYQAEMAESTIAKRSVLDNMVEQELIRQYVNEVGYGVSDSQLIAEIMQVPDFQQNGKFDKEVYKRMVNSQRMSEAQFEAQVRQDLLLRQFQENLQHGSLITKHEIEEIAQLQSQVRKARLLTLPESVVSVSQDVSDEDVQKHYDKTKESYAIPEAVKAAYVSLSVAGLSKGIEIDDARVADLYEHNKASLKSDELRDVSHILLTVAKEEDDDAVLARVTTIQESLKAGKDFAALATEHSEDTGSALKGGALGYVARETLEPEIDKVIFAMQAGTVSEPVRTRFGYHLVKLNKIKAPEIKPLAEVKAMLIKDEQTRQAQELFFDQADQFSNLAYENADTLTPLEDTLNLKTQHSGWVSRSGGKGIFANQNLVQALFRDEVLKDGQNTEVVELSDTHYIVLRILEHREKAYKPVDEVRAELEKSILKNRATEALTEKAKALVASLNTDNNFAKVGEDLGLQWQKSTDYNTDSEGLSPAVKQSLFSMQKPATDKPRYSFVKGVPHTIIGLEAVRMGEVDAEKQSTVQTGLKSAVTSALVRDFVANLRHTAKVNVFYEQVLDDNL